MTTTYSIKDLEKFSGIKAHTIRIWEKRFQIFTPDRTETNIRRYSEEELKYLLNVSVLYNKGMKISEIMNLPPDLMRERVMQLAIQSDGIESHLENLVIAMIELNEDLFDKTFNTSMIKLGFEKTIIQLIYPFFEKIGLLWQTGSIIPTQEHFISNLIRQKLIVAIDSITAPRSATAKSFLLYLPENEWHELGLLFKHYLIKKRGHRVIYLGPNVPFGNLKTVIQSVKPCCIVGQYITSRSFEESKTDLQNLAEYASSIQIFISGNFLQKNPDLLPKGLLAYKNIYEFLEQTE